MYVVINDLEKLVLEKFQYFKALRYETTAFLKPGENYGSLLFMVTITAEDNERNALVLHFVAKTIPSSKLFQKQFNIQITFQRELALYNIIAPALTNFQIEQKHPNPGLPLPTFYAGRICLNPDSKIVDDDAIMLIENLTFSGFKTLNRMDGLNLDEAKIVLRSLAIFHATPVAFKILKRDLFVSTFLPHLSSVNTFTVSEEVGKAIVGKILRTALSNEKCLQLVANIINAFKIYDNYKDKRPPAKEPFATIIHNDFWLNNLMIKVVNNVPVECRLLDFQTIEYGSPCHDIIFFLYTSVKQEVLDDEFNNLVHFYFEVFVNTLESLQCKSKLFTYEGFLEELEEAAKIQFKHILVMLQPVLCLKGGPKTLDKMSEADLVGIGSESPEYYRRVPEVVLDYYDRGWI